MDNDISRQGGSVFDRPNQRPQVTDGSRRVPVQSLDSYRRPNAPPPEPQPRPQVSMAPQPVPNPGYPPQPNPTPAPQPTQAPNPSPSLSPQPSLSPDMDSVYAAASNGVADIDKPMPLPNVANPAVIKKKDASEVKTVQIFGAVMAVLSILSLITWLNTGIKNTEETLGFVFALAGLLLAAGLFLKRELVRTVYVIAAITTLVFSLYGTINYVSEDYNYNHSQNSAIIGLQAAIKKYQNDNSISDAQKAKYIGVLEKSEAFERKQSYSIKIPLTTVLFEYLVCVPPLAVLTRPKLKKAFS